MLAVIAEVGWPAKQIQWKQFCDQLRARCSVESNTLGYGDWTIKRIVAEMKDGSTK